ncbi:hypothetical protein [Pseudaestuariivita rosea]|uniref:hypothetical protein n=1 Tax=Pseudaestuariivita rosea TaxID=2763263 RepID=UPI001ABB7429|nr:hypothetical protein [Pseudaestuariivita rosea]
MTDDPKPTETEPGLPPGAKAGPIDKETGGRWVEVTPAMAHAHPKGKPGIAIWLIVAWFGTTAILQITMLLIGTLPIFLIFLPIINALTAVALASRAPAAVWLTMIAGGLQVLLMMMAASPITVFTAAITLLIIFYILDGDRPNLIYRHRYRSFRKDKE